MESPSAQNQRRAGDDASKKMVEAGIEAMQLSLQQFQELATELGVLLAPEKAKGSSSSLVFLGIELDTVKMEARLPQAKTGELLQ
ncbi:hypothetical protein NDU88_008926 [Pleurodeles waltl]|uniref:Uncharacterized protein n=1 Tax=Pleurodeles waltl TaxID=8319 RepID=A0AAV7PR89_PLEWA|nr:hypothetical protein NDU88_008926 [Pleurodeles waltl]